MVSDASLLYFYCVATVAVVAVNFTASELCTLFSCVVVFSSAVASRMNSTFVVVIILFFALGSKAGLGLLQAECPSRCQTYIVIFIIIEYFRSDCFCF